MIRTLLIVIFCGFSSLSEATVDKLVIGKKINQTYNKIDKESRMQRTIQSTLFNINKQIKKTSKKKTKILSELLNSEAKAKYLAGQIFELQGRLKAQKIELIKKIELGHKLKETGLLYFLMSAQSSTEFDKNLKILDLIVEKDFELIKNYKNNLGSLDIKKLKLKDRIYKLARIKKKSNDFEKKLASEQLQKVKILKELRLKYKNHLKKLSSMRKKYSKDSALDELLKVTFFEQKGKLNWPVNGVSSNRFGIEKDRKYKILLREKGIFYAARSSSYVFGIHPGVVEYAGPLEGWGLTVIVNHGGSFYTVYGNNSEIFVSKGEEISVQQELGKVGLSSTGRSGLYFEIRHFSEPLDPSHWLTKKPSHFSEEKNEKI